VVRIDIDGNVLEGRWPAAPGVQLHLALHRVRDDAAVAIHNHPRWATVWADARRIPGVIDQSSALGGGKVVVVDEYEGTVLQQEAARAAVTAMGDADIALLAGHGLFLVGLTCRARTCGPSRSPNGATARRWSKASAARPNCAPTSRTGWAPLSSTGTGKPWRAEKFARDPSVLVEKES